MHLNANSKEKPKNKLLNNPKIIDKFHMPLPTNENISQIKNKLLGMTNKTIRQYSINPSKPVNLQNEKEILISDKENDSKKFKKNKSEYKLTNPNTNLNSNYMLQMENQKVLMKQKSVEKTSNIKNNSKFSSYILDKSLSHRIKVMNTINQMNTSKQNAADFSNRNQFKDYNSNNKSQKNNFIIDDKINLNENKRRPINSSKENLKNIYKPQMILIEDRSEVREIENLHKKKLGGKLNLNVKNLKNNKHNKYSSMNGIINNYSKSTNQSSNFNNLLKKSSNINEIFFKNFKEKIINNNKGKSLINKEKNTMNMDLLNKMDYESIKLGYNTAENLNACLGTGDSDEMKPLNTLNSLENIYSKSTSNMLSENGFIKKNIVNMKIQTGSKSKHEDYKKIQERVNNVKIPKDMNITQKEKEFDKLFLSMAEDIEINYVYTEGAEIPSMNNTMIKSSPEDKNNDSGVLTFDEVKDIIIYYHFKDVDYNDRNIFYKYDNEIFNSENKSKYVNLFFNNQQEERIIFDNNNKSYSTKDSSSNKKNFTPVIKSH